MAITQELQDAIDAAYGNFVRATNALKILYLDNEANKEILEEVLRRQPGSVADWVHPQIWTMAWLDAQARLEQPPVDNEEIAKQQAEKIREREFKLNLKDRRDGSPAGNRISLREEARRGLRDIHEGIAELIVKDGNDLLNSLPQPAAPKRELPTPEEMADGVALSRRELEQMTRTEVKNYLHRARLAEEIVRQRNLES